MPTWRLRPELLEDQVFRSALSEATANYFTENEGSTGSAQIEWDAYKTVMRGVAISINTGTRAVLI